MNRTKLMAAMVLSALAVMPVAAGTASGEYTYVVDIDEPAIDSVLGRSTSS